MPTVGKIGPSKDALARGTIRPRRKEDFDQLYKTMPAWQIGKPQPAFQSLADSGALRGRILDVGCGTGEHALMAAAIGLDATGIDFAQAAIAAAQAKAQSRGLNAHFHVWDALQLPSLGQQFDTVLDCGLFHVLEDPDRGLFAASLRSVVQTGGRYFMLCFSDQQPGHWGPRRIAQSEIRGVFNDGWRVDAIEPSRMEVRIFAESAIAWLACCVAV